MKKPTLLCVTALMVLIQLPTVALCQSAETNDSARSLMEAVSNGTVHPGPSEAKRSAQTPILEINSAFRPEAQKLSQQIDLRDFLWMFWLIPVVMAFLGLKRGRKPNAL